MGYVGMEIGMGAGERKMEMGSVREECKTDVRNWRWEPQRVVLMMMDGGGDVMIGGDDGGYMVMVMQKKGSVKRKGTETQLTTALDTDKRQERYSERESGSSVTNGERYWSRWYVRERGMSTRYVEFGTGRARMLRRECS